MTGSGERLSFWIGIDFSEEAVEAALSSTIERRMPRFLKAEFPGSVRPRVAAILAAIEFRYAVPPRDREAPPTYWESVGMSVDIAYRVIPLYSRSRLVRISRTHVRRC
jgi:hypothetical protein